MTYAIRWGYMKQREIRLTGVSLPAAITVCKAYRAEHADKVGPMYSEPEIFRPDNIDLGCANGLNRSEREIIAEHLS